MLREVLTASRILMTISIGLAVVSVAHVAGLTVDAPSETLDERLRAAVKLGLASIVLGACSYVAKQIESGRFVAAGHREQAAIPFAFLFVAGIAAEWNAAVAGTLEMSAVLLVLIVLLQVTAATAIVGFLRKRALGWYAAWSSIFFFVAAVVYLGPEFGGSIEAVKGFALPFALLGCALLGLQISGDELLAELTIDRQSRLRRLNLLFAVSGMAVLVVRPFGYIVAAVLIVLALLGRERLQLRERMLSPWSRPPPNGGKSE